MFGWLRNKTQATKEEAKKVVGVENIKETTDEIKNLGLKYLTPYKTIKNAKQETFEEAMKRLSVSEIDLLKNYKNFAIAFYVSLLFALISFIGFGYYSFFEQKIIASLSMVAMWLLFMVNAFKFSFRAFQIKHRSLCSVRDWWEKADDWFPNI